MSPKQCCRNCQHCADSRTELGGWCCLRQLSLHSEVAQFAFCHHWTEREPVLPTLSNSATESSRDLQLELGRGVVVTGVSDY